MKILSIRQPWAWAIIAGFKPIENRSWKTNVRGLIGIHAGIKYDCDGAQWIRERFPEISIPQLLPIGGIIGTAELVDCVEKSDSPWFFGPYGFVLKKARATPFLPMKGKLGFFELKSAESLEDKWKARA